MAKQTATKAGQAPRDGDHDGFVTGPDGKDNVPVAATAAPAKPLDEHTRRSLLVEARSIREKAAALRQQARQTAFGDAEGGDMRAAAFQLKRDATALRQKAKAGVQKPADRPAAEPKAAPAKPDHSGKAPHELDDADLGSEVDATASRAADALGKGDYAAHAAHSERLDNLLAEQERRTAPPAPKGGKTADKPGPGATDKPSAAGPASGDSGWKDAATPAEFDKGFGKLLNTTNVTGISSAFPQPPGADLGETADPASHLRRANRAAADMARTFAEHPRLAELRDAHPLGLVGVAPTEVVAVGTNVVNGFHTTATGADGSSTTLLVVGAPPLRPGKLALGGQSVGQDITAAMRHEYGHHMEAAMPAERAAFEGIYKGNDRGGLVGKLTGSNAAKAKQAWASGVSAYGASSASELWAESFTAYTHPDYGKSGSPQLPATLHAFWSKALPKSR